jgi:hypothetical protein
MAVGEGWVYLDELSPDIRDEPWSLYWKEWKSGTPEFEALLHDPLEVLSKQIPGVTREWTVATEFVNHERGLSNNIVCKLAMVMPDEKRVLLLFYKH